MSSWSAVSSLFRGQPLLFTGTLPVGFGSYGAKPVCPRLPGRVGGMSVVSVRRRLRAVPVCVVRAPRTGWGLALVAVGLAVGVWRDMVGPSVFRALKHLWRRFSWWNGGERRDVFVGSAPERRLDKSGEKSLEVWEDRVKLQAGKEAREEMENGWETSEETAEGSHVEGAEAEEERNEVRWEDLSGTEKRKSLERAMRAAKKLDENKEEEFLRMRRDRKSEGESGTGESRNSQSRVGRRRDTKGQRVKNERKVSPWILRAAEQINGRAASIGFVLCLLREALEPGHPSLFEQVEQVVGPIAAHTPAMLVAMYSQVIDILT